MTDLKQYNCNLKLNLCNIKMNRFIIFDVFIQRMEKLWKKINVKFKTKEKLSIVNPYEEFKLCHFIELYKLKSKCRRNVKVIENAIIDLRVCTNCSIITKNCALFLTSFGVGRNRKVTNSESQKLLHRTSWFLHTVYFFL